MSAPPTVRRVSILPPGQRERRREGTERRRADRRLVDLGSPYGVERRSGQDDRQADRRGLSKRPAGLGLTRDYFAQADEQVAPAGAVVPSHLVERFSE